MRKTSTTASRRAWITGAASGVGLFALRRLATGLPASWLMGSRVAHAADLPKPQYFILSTSILGDPLNANCPGSYVTGVQNNPLPEMAPVGFQLGATKTTAAKCWSTLAPALRARTAFFHHRTYTNAHPEHRKVMTLHGAAKAASGNGEEMLPSVFASELAGALGTTQKEPVPIGQELVTYEGRPLGGVTPTDLKSLFDQPDDLLSKLSSLRDREIDAIYHDLRANGTPMQKQFLDRYALGRDQARTLGDQLGALLSRLPVDPDESNSPVDQMIAAVALIKLKVAPVVTIHLPFGGDNHADGDLTLERDQTLKSVNALNALWAELLAQGLEDQVTFASLNVFGRTLTRTATGGRTHNQNHHVMMMFGKKIAGGVIGGVAPENGGMATAIDSKTGRASTMGDIDPLSSLESAAKTLWVALDLPAAGMNSRINGGKVVTAALAR